MSKRYNSDIHHRRSIRLSGYNYAQVGAYFVTICVQHRMCLFGDITDGVLQLSDAGRMIQSTWDEIPHYYPGADIDAFVVMPNHVHGIIILTASDSVGLSNRNVASISLPDVIGRFKSLTTTRYRHSVVNHAWQPFLGTLWQRNYYDRIIRGEGELNRIRDYISNNPARWTEDTQIQRDRDI